MQFQRALSVFACLHVIALAACDTAPAPGSGPAGAAASAASAATRNYGPLSSAAPGPAASAAPPSTTVGGAFGPERLKLHDAMQFVHPPTPWKETYPQIVAKLGEPAGTVGAAVFWRAIDGESCARLTLERDGDNVKAGDIKGAYPTEVAEWEACSGKRAEPASAPAPAAAPEAAKPPAPAASP